MAAYPNRLLHFYVKAIGQPGMVNTMSGTIPSDVYWSTTRAHRPSRTPVPATAAFMQELPPVPPPLPGAGSVSISGYEQFVWECPEGGFSFSTLSVSDEPAMPMSPGDGCYRVYDGGALTLTVNGVNKTVSYGNGSTAANRAAALAQAINAATNFPVYATYTAVPRA